MTKEIEKLELAILSDVFRYRRVVDLKLPIYFPLPTTQNTFVSGKLVAWSIMTSVRFDTSQTICNW